MSVGHISTPLFPESHELDEFWELTGKYDEYSEYQMNPTIGSSTAYSDGLYTLIVGSGDGYFIDGYGPSISIVELPDASTYNGIPIAPLSIRRTWHDELGVATYDIFVRRVAHSTARMMRVNDMESSIAASNEIIASIERANKAITWMYKIINSIQGEGSSGQRKQRTV